MKARYDVVVLGGSPSGSAAAAALVRRSLSVLVAEEQQAVSFKVGESLPGIGRSVVARAGFPDILRTVEQVKCSGNRSCWGSSEPNLRPGLLDPYGGGIHLNRAQFDQALLCGAAAAGAHVCHGSRFHHAERSGKGWIIFLQCGTKLCSIECDSVVDCTGRRACFARTQGAKRVTVDKQVAIVSVLSGANIVDNDMTTTIETTPDGWWYSAAIPNQKRVVVFFSDGDLIVKLRARSRDAFMRLMKQSPLMGAFLELGYILEFELVAVLADTSYLTSAAGDGWCAAGDAAAALDPLASTGIIDALNSGVAAAEVVLSGFKNTAYYSKMVLDRAKANIEMRRSYYAMEQRWPQAPFWVRRYSRMS